MTIMPFKDIRPGDVFTVTRQNGRVGTYRTTYYMEENRVVYLHPAPRGFMRWRSGMTWSDLQKCEKHCPGGKE